jgi:peptidoglycan/LPS O-acetylase OafA/YrhL
VRPGRLDSLEIVRAICALLVLFAHVYGEALDLRHHVIGVSIASFSLEAVAGFFVLSGCVISLQDYDGIGAYMRARLVRILPIYYLLLAGSVIAMAGCGLTVGAWRVLANAGFAQSLFWDPVFPVRFYVPSWSLAYELYYYAAFVALLALPRLLAPLMMASIAAGLAMYAVPYEDGPLNAVLHALGYFSMWLAGVVVTRLWRAGYGLSIETGVFLLAAGICLSRVPLSEPAKYDFFRLAGFAFGFAGLIWALVSARDAESRRILGLGFVPRCIVSVLLLALLWRVSTSHLGMKTAVTAVLLFVTVAPAFAVRGGLLALRPTKAFLVYVGGLSYALYLVHYPLVQTFNALALFAPVANVGIVTVLSFAMAHLLDYRFQPWVRARLRRPS